MRTFSILFYSLLIAFVLSGCYSFTGASIEGKTINITPVLNRSLNVVPSLAPSLTEKIQNRILSQTGLSPVNDIMADYYIETVVTSYNVSIAGVANNTSVAKNRLTISVSVDFKNKLNPKSNFKQSFSRFRDYDANIQLQSVESQLIGEIGTELADDIFNKAFVNW